VTLAFSAQLGPTGTSGRAYHASPRHQSDFAAKSRQGGRQSEYARTFRAVLLDWAKEIVQFRAGLRPGLMLRSEPSAFPPLYQRLSNPNLSVFGFSEPLATPQRLEAMWLQRPVGSELAGMYLL
jgi:hypothetical protein